MTRPDDAVVAEMEALVRNMAGLQPTGQYCGNSVFLSGDHHRKACDIVAKLPAPADPDLLEARRIAATIIREHSLSGFYGLADQINAGDMDNKPEVLIPLAAIKRGRELAAAEARS